MVFISFAELSKIELCFFPRAPDPTGRDAVPASKTIFMAKETVSKPKKKKAKIKEGAKLIYLREDISQKDIALKVGVNEKTIKRWIDEGHWDALKTTLLTTKEYELKNLYDVLAL